MKGYFGVVQPSMIIEYTTDAERGKYCGKYHGKKQRYDENFDAVEQWMVSSSRSRLKVKSGTTTFYFTEESEAQKKARECGSKVSLVEVEVRVTTKNRVKPVEQRRTEIPAGSIDVYDIDSYITENMNSMLEFINRIKDYGYYLAEELSIVDKKIVDIEHAMEFQKLDAAGGYMMYKRMHTTLNERRKIKDNIERVNNILNTGLTSGVQASHSKVNREINRTYRPRILKELFV